MLLLPSRFLLTCTVAFGLTRAAAGQGVDEIRASYRKAEYRVRMRDGVQLFTSVFTPRDTTRSYPIMLNRTPYGVAPYGDTAYRNALGPSPRFARQGFIFVYQDVRGRFMSEGTYAFMTPHIDRKTSPRDVDESTDTYDTIDWLVKNIPHNNGRVGTWGISAPGFFTAAGMIDAHPALKAASPQAPLVDWYKGDDRHHNGALTLAQTFNFLSGFDRPRDGPTTTYGARPNFGTTDGYRFFLDNAPNAKLDQNWLHGSAVFWNAIMQHPNYDAFWQQRSLQYHLRDIKPAVLHVGGWYDAEDPFGPLEAFRAMSRLSQGSTFTLVMGPWAHGDWSRTEGDTFGPVRFGAPTGPFYRDSVEFPFFMCHLADRCDAPLPKALVYQTGANQWRRFDAWPPKEARSQTLYLNTGGRLTWTPPPANGGFDAWMSDPAKPVPYTSATSFGYYRQYPIEDQRFAASRPDVIVFQTDALQAPLTLAGPINVSLRVSSSGTDADFIVKVIDVYTDSMPPSASAVANVNLGGYQQLVRGDVMRARFRKSFTTPAPLVPNEPTTVSFTIQDVFHTFRPGHRLMVQVQSSWFPLIDRNPQTFVANINAATAADFRIATQRVYHSQARPSSLTLTILPDVAKVTQ
jgi:putative CocE/NonD family hydrolase